MTEMFITQCPHCQTSFRLKQSQLSAARGTVRCGACLQVFNAASQITTDTAPAAAEPTAAHAAPMPGGENAESQAEHAAVTPRLKKPLMIHDDMDLEDLNDLDLDEELARLEQEEQRTHELTSEFCALATTEPQLSPELQNDIQDTADSSTLDDLTDELLAQEPVAKLSSSPPDEAQAAADIEQTPEPASSAKASSVLETTAAEMTVEATSDHLAHFADEPLRLDWRPRKSPWRRWLGWGLLNSLALLLLLGQYTHKNFAELARQDSTRPWLETLCQLIDCQLPSKVDVQQIKSSNLLVRSHPEFSGALLVDAIIYNRASFSQPFPLLEMRFSNLNGTPLASRLFKPQEYLGGELAGQTHMPPQTPIHIALEILEPSGGAVNYSLDFVSPD